MIGQRNNIPAVPAVKTIDKTNCKMKLLKISFLHSSAVETGVLFKPAFFHDLIGNETPYIL